MTKVLILSSQTVLDGAVLEYILQQSGARLSALSVVTTSHGLREGSLAKEAYAAVFSFVERSSQHTSNFLGELYKCLVPAGSLTVVERGHQDTNATEKQVVLAGFAECKSAVSPTGDSMVVAKKPAWQSGAKQTIKLSKKEQKPQPWSIAAAADADDELVDDDDLLTEQDRQKPTAADCKPSSISKKACKDCTCGRAEGRIEQVQLTQDMLDNPQSGCGSCGLGDAFRCGSCPYRGLPAFEKGKKIELPSDFLMADV